VPLWGGPCRNLVHFDGRSLTLSGLIGPEALNLSLGSVGVKREVVQVASELAQTFDQLQFSNCQKIEQVPANSPERVKLIYEAIESEKQLLQLALLTKALAISPNSDRLQQAIVNWVASSARRAAELVPALSSPGLTRGGPARGGLQARLEEASKAEPRLRTAMRRGSPFDLSEVLKA
jgi:hypothetical protein